MRDLDCNEVAFSFFFHNKDFFYQPDKMLRILSLGKV